MRSIAAPGRAPRAFAVLGLVVSMIIVVRRNFFEDEWLSLAFVQKPLGQLWRWTFECGCHPPGALAVDWLALQVLHSVRAVAALHGVVWIAAVAWYVASAGRLLRSDWGRACFAALAFLHPLTLMWAGSFRWYGLWWAVALAILAAGLLPRRDDRPPSWAVTLALGVGGAILLYLDYVAVIFMPCFAVAWLVRHGVNRPALARLLAMGAVALVLAWPVVTSLPDQEALARCSVEVRDRLGAALHMAHGLSIGEAIMPWHPVAVLVGLGLLIPGLWWCARGLMRRAPEAEAGTVRQALVSQLCFLLLMVACAIVSGLGTKPRSFLGLATIVSLFIAWGAEHATSRRARGVLAALMTAWVLTGAIHLVTRTGTAKRQLNDRPEQVIAHLEGLAVRRPVLVFTTSLVLTYEINQRRARGYPALLVCSTWNDPVHGFPAGLPASGTEPAWIMVVADAESGGDVVDRLSDASRALIQDPRVENLGHDPDAVLKSWVSGRKLETHRFTVWHGAPGAGDREAVGELFTAAARGTLLGDGR